MSTKLKSFQQYVNESADSDYIGGHQAPGVEDSAPLHDTAGIYPDDIYSWEALALYGHNEDKRVDQESISIIRACHHKPNKPVKIYRAVPDLNHEVAAQSRAIRALFTYHGKYGFYPLGNAIIRELTAKYPIDVHSYPEQQALIVQDLERQLEALATAKKAPLKLNNGDWVTISRGYAVQHGISNLNGKYKIVTKVVAAKDLYTEGNDINEWGYNTGA